MCYFVLYVDSDTIDVLHDVDFWLSVLFLVLLCIIQFTFYILSKRARKHEIDRLKLQMAQDRREDKMVNLPIYFCHNDFQIAEDRVKTDPSGFALSSQSPQEIGNNVNDYESKKDRNFFSLS